MDVTSIAIIIFMILETLNVIVLYFKPGSRLSNGVGVFNAWEKSREDPDLHEFVRYLVFWVAGTKLIFIVLLLVILLTTGKFTRQMTIVALIASILSFFWRLFPIIRKLDKGGQITPLGYSRALGFMITGFLGLFILTLIVSLLF